MNGVMWSILSEWDGINVEVKAEVNAEVREALINKNPKNVGLIRGKESGLIILGFGQK